MQAIKNVSCYYVAHSSPGDEPPAFQRVHIQAASLPVASFIDDFVAPYDCYVINPEEARALHCRAHSVIKTCSLPVLLLATGSRTLKKLPTVFPCVDTFCARHIAKRSLPRGAREPAGRRAGAPT